MKSLVVLLSLIIIVVRYIRILLINFDNRNSEYSRDRDEFLNKKFKSNNNF